MEEQGQKDASQTLLRGLDILDAVAEAPITLDALARRLSLSRSTVHRLAAALVQRGYVSSRSRLGYRLGPKLLALGHAASEQSDIVYVARPFIGRLAESSGDTAHLGVLDSEQALYLDKVPGNRRVAISSRVGDRQPLTTTGLGKALILDHDRAYWRSRHAADGSSLEEGEFLSRMTSYAAAGCAFDLEENEDRIRCVAAPVRDAAGRIIAAISVSSAAQYMSDDRMSKLSNDVLTTAAAISTELGLGLVNDRHRAKIVRHNIRGRAPPRNVV